MNLELVKTELAMYGILLRPDGDCTVVRNGERQETNVLQEVRRLSSEIKENQRLYDELWSEVVSLLTTRPAAISAGGEITSCIFTESIKRLYRIAHKKGLVQEKILLKEHLRRDVNSFSENYMSNVIDYKIGLEWLDHVIGADKYRLRLLSAYLRLKNNPKTVTALAGPWSNLDLPMEERVWDYVDEQESTEGREKDKQDQQRYKLPDTYNDPYEIEEGFYYREIRNEPYSFDDEDNNTYPHRNLLWD